MNSEKLPEIRRLAEKATAMDFDSAEIKRESCGYIECARCEGSGEIEIAAQYTNFDDAPIGVQFFGIGGPHVNAEEYYRAVKPSVIIEMIDAIYYLHAELNKLQVMK